MSDTWHQSGGNGDKPVTLSSRLARVLRYLRNTQCVAGLGLVGPSKAACLRLEAMAMRRDEICRTAKTARVTRPCGSNRRELPRTVADQQKPGPQHRLPHRLLAVVRNSPISTQTRLTNRTAVYGPVRTVVWEGIRREADPYPD